MIMTINEIEKLLGDQANSLLSHTCNTIKKETLHATGPDFLDRIFVQSDRSPQTLRSLQALYGTGRLANTAMCLSFR